MCNINFKRYEPGDDVKIGKADKGFGIRRDYPALSENSRYGLLYASGFRDNGSFCKGNKVCYGNEFLSADNFYHKILLFANGAIAEQGSHESLMSTDSVYKSLFQLQAQYYSDGESVSKKIDNSL